MAAPRTTAATVKKRTYARTRRISDGAAASRPMSLRSFVRTAPARCGGRGPTTAATKTYDIIAGIGTYIIREHWTRIVRFILFSPGKQLTTRNKNKTHPTIVILLLHILICISVSAGSGSTNRIIMLKTRWDHSGAGGRARIFIL